MTVARLSGRVAGGATGPGVPSLLAGTGSCWSGWVWDGLDALPGGGDRFCPGPGGGDFQGSAASAAGEAGGVQDAVAGSSARPWRGRRPAESWAPSCERYALRRSPTLAVGCRCCCQVPIAASWTFGARASFTAKTIACRSREVIDRSSTLDPIFTFKVKLLPASGSTSKVEVRDGCHHDARCPAQCG